MRHKFIAFLVALGISTIYGASQDLGEGLLSGGGHHPYHHQHHQPHHLQREPDIVSSTAGLIASCCRLSACCIRLCALCCGDSKTPEPSPRATPQSPPAPAIRRVPHALLERRAAAVRQVDAIVMRSAGVFDQGKASNLALLRARDREATFATREQRARERFDAAKGAYPATLPAGQSTREMADGHGGLTILVSTGSWNTDQPPVKRQVVARDQVKAATRGAEQAAAEVARLTAELATLQGAIDTVAADGAAAQTELVAAKRAVREGNYDDVPATPRPQPVPKGAGPELLAERRIVEGTQGDLRTKMAAAREERERVAAALAEVTAAHSRAAGEIAEEERKLEAAKEAFQAAKAAKGEPSQAQGYTGGHTIIVGTRGWSASDPLVAAQITLCQTLNKLRPAYEKFTADRARAEIEIDRIDILIRDLELEDVDAQAALARTLEAFAEAAGS